MVKANWPLLKIIETCNYFSYSRVELIHILIAVKNTPVGIKIEILNISLYECFYTVENEAENDDIDKLCEYLNNKFVNIEI